MLSASISSSRSFFFSNNSSSCFKNTAFSIVSPFFKRGISDGFGHPHRKHDLRVFCMSPHPDGHRQSPGLASAPVAWTNSNGTSSSVSMDSNPESSFVVSSSSSSCLVSSSFLISLNKSVAVSIFFSFISSSSSSLTSVVFAFFFPLVSFSSSSSLTSSFSSSFCSFASAFSFCTATFFPNNFALNAAAAETFASVSLPMGLTSVNCADLRFTPFVFAAIYAGARSEALIEPPKALLPIKLLWLFFL